MTITITSTEKIVQLQPYGIAARIWEGITDTGIPVHCFVSRIVVSKEDDTTQFEKELQEHKPPSADVAAYPLRLIL